MQYDIDSDGGPKYPDADAEPGAFGRYASSLWREQDHHLTDLHNVWVQNLLFLTNRQWWRKTRLGFWAPEKAPSWRKQPVSNLTLAFFRTYLAKATKSRPAWQVIPASGAPGDIKAAELADEILEAKWIELKLGAVVRRLVAWTIATGNGFLYPYWNEQSGRIRPLEVEQERPILDDEGRQVDVEIVMVPVDEDGEPLPEGADPIMVDEGEVGVKAVSPFQVRVNPEAETDDEVTWFLVAESMTLRQIRQRWGDKAEGVIAEDTGDIDDYDRLLAGVMGGGDTALVAGGGDDRTEDMPKALVFHYHERPSPTYPGGRFWIATKDVELDEPTDLPEGFWPALIHLGDVTIPGRYYHASVLESIVGLNREYNEQNQAISEHHNLMARGKWLVEKGAGVAKTALTNQPGEVVEYNKGFSVKQADIRPLPDGVYKERERILSDWEMVGGVHKVSLGKPPPGVTAGVAFLQLQEADDTDLGPLLAQLEEGVATLARAVLAIIKARYDDERIAYVPGADRRYLVKYFRAADLAGAVDVVPVAESSFPWSKTAKQSMLLELAAKIPQLFTDPQTGQFDSFRFGRLLPIGGLDSFSTASDLDVQEAQREEDMFSEFGTTSNELPEVGFWQDHQIHYRQHTQLLKTSEFREWPSEIQKAFKAHVMEHDQHRAQALLTGTDSPNAQAAIGQAQAAPGGPGDPGPGGDPAEVDVESVEGQGPPASPARSLPPSGLPLQGADQLETDPLAGL